MAQPNILEYLPDVFAEVKEIIAHAKAEQPELELLWSANDAAYDDQFLYSLTENGIKRWESILNIQPLGGDSLEDRRFRIISRFNARLPYTYRMLEAMLNQMCGKDGYTMSYDSSNFTLKVRVSLTRKSQVNEVKRLLLEVVPVNIILDYDLQYNSHRMLSQLTHRFLSAYTHEEIRTTPF